MTYKDYLYSKAARQRIPLGGTFELSPVCNFSCHMCYVRKTKAELARLGKREITADEWIRMGKECRDAGMLYLLLTGGEPFLYPEFRRLYEALHEMGLLLILNTNGTLIDEETVGWLKDRAPSRVNVTLYGASRETYGRVCQNSDGFELAERGCLGNGYKQRDAVPCRAEQLLDKLGRKDDCLRHDGLPGRMRSVSGRLSAMLGEDHHGSAQTAGVKRM